MIDRDDVQRLLDRYGRAEILDDLVLVQSGHVLMPAAQGLSCADRFAGFYANAVGSGDVLVDDERHWAHLRRPSIPHV